MIDKRVKVFLAANAVAALVSSANFASAATIVDDMGVLDPNGSVSGSVTLTRTASILTYNFGSTGAEVGFSNTVPSTSGALNVAFEFEVNGSPLTLVNADAENPLNELELGPVSSSVGANITVTDGLGGPVVLGPSYFVAAGNSYDAATSTVTLLPGTYYEYINGSAAKGRTLVNVGAFAGGAVPEPSSWALMIVGLGMVGSVQRTMRRKNRASLALT